MDFKMLAKKAAENMMILKINEDHDIIQYRSIYEEEEENPLIFVRCKLHGYWVSVACTKECYDEYSKYNSREENKMSEPNFKYVLFTKFYSEDNLFEIVHEEPYVHYADALRDYEEAKSKKNFIRAYIDMIGEAAQGWTITLKSCRTFHAEENNKDKDCVYRSLEDLKKNL